MLNPNAKIFKPQIQNLDVSDFKCPTNGVNPNAEVFITHVGYWEAIITNNNVSYTKLATNMSCPD